MNNWGLVPHVIMAIPNLLIKKGIITTNEWKAAIMESAKMSESELDEMIKEMQKKGD